MSFRHAGPSNSALVLNYTKELAYGLKKIWTEIALRGSLNRVGAWDIFFCKTSEVCLETKSEFVLLIP